MTPKKQTQSQHNEDLDSRVSLLEYQFEKIVVPKLTSIDLTQKEILSATNTTQRQIDTLKYVSQHEYDTDKKDLSKVFATKEEISNVRKLVYWMLGILGTVVAGTALAFVGASLR